MTDCYGNTLQLYPKWLKQEISELPPAVSENSNMVTREPAGPHTSGSNRLTLKVLTF